jgi:secretion/DNA translocation related TadE-like protein
VKAPGAAADQGAATVWVLSAAFVLAAAALLVVGQGTAVLIRHRAAMAADAAALAAATHALDGPRVGCAAARGSAAENHARLVGCRVVGGTTTVATEVSMPAWMPWAGAASGVARAEQMTTDQMELHQAGRRRNLAPSTSLSGMTTWRW